MDPSPLLECVHQSYATHLSCRLCIDVMWLQHTSLVSVFLEGCCGICSQLSQAIAGHLSVLMQVLRVTVARCLDHWFHLLQLALWTPLLLPKLVLEHSQTSGYHPVEDLRSCPLCYVEAFIFSLIIGVAMFLL